MDTLSIKKVSKSFGSFVAVDNISFDVRSGCIFGILGPNGAGKTTLIRIINSITMADEGEIWFMGEVAQRRHQALIGYLPEERGLYKKMSVLDHLIYLGQLKGLSLSTARERVKTWFAKLEMDGWEKKKIQDLSKGMQQKVQFVGTVLHQPKLLILDEPFSGLDPVNTNMIKKEIIELKENGTTILFSTHRMEQVEEICEEIVLVNQGKVLLSGEIQSIKQQYKDHIYHFSFVNPEKISELDHLEVVRKNGAGDIVVKMASMEAANHQIKQWLDQEVYLSSFHEILPSINDIFIKVVTEASVEKVEV